MRQKTALRLIDEYTNAGYTITQISEKCNIATSTISKWYHDACPTPRTLSKLDRIGTEIQLNKQRNKLIIRMQNWGENGGKERVRAFNNWLVDNEDDLCNNKDGTLKNPEAFAHWQKEIRHKEEGKNIGAI